VTIIATLKDGHTIAKATGTVVVPIAGGNVSVSITFSELRQIDAVLQVQVDGTDPPVNIEGEVGTHKNIVGNVVGFTIFGVSAGTTLTASAVAIGE